jgi:pimeloyl-ACP methyl ester carboxylesterase
MLAALRRKKVDENGAGQRKTPHPARGRHGRIASLALPPLPGLDGVRHAEHDLPTGVRMHVAEAGDPTAPAVLAVHGWPQHWWVWRGVIGPLARTHRVICPDLRGFGWSGPPADGDFTKDRLADDMIALLDVLEIERAGYLGHDWGGWTGWLVAIRARERLSRLMTVAIVHPWPPRAAALLNAWRLAYQLPIAAPVIGPAIVRQGDAVRRVLRPSMTEADAAIFADVLREPARAAASSALYRQFQLRELPALAAGKLAAARVEVPVLQLFPRGDAVQTTAMLHGLERHAPQAQAEIVDGGHFLVDQRPQLVADRACTWFA